MLFHQPWQPKNHTLGTCWIAPTNDLMYVNISKNASSWTKPNLEELGWVVKNYHLDHLTNYHSLIVLRDPVERWVSGIAEYFSLYHPDFDLDDFNKSFIDFIMEQVEFDEHTARQVYFIRNIDPNRCTFMMADDSYRTNFTNWLKEQGYANVDYTNRVYQHTTIGNPVRKKYATFFRTLLDNPVYLEKIKKFYHLDYRVIWSVRLYGSKQLSGIHRG